MQRYGDLKLNTNNWVNSFLVCCDRKPDLRQKGEMGINLVALFTKKTCFVFILNTNKNKEI
jgi:hypothetical protein